MDRIDSADGVFITAEGLLMYLQPDEAIGLITECAKRFPGGQMFFDLPPTILKKVAPKASARPSTTGFRPCHSASPSISFETWRAVLPGSKPSATCRCLTAAASYSGRSFLPSGGSVRPNRTAAFTRCSNSVDFQPNSASR